MKINVQNLFWSLLKYIGSAVVIMWLVFWYLSGSFWGLPRFGVTYYVATQKFMTPISKDVLFDGILKGMIASLGEPHSVYLDQKDLNTMKEHTSGTYAGVGMVLGYGERGLEAVSVIEDQPAFKAGIKSGDYIVSINGEDTNGMKIEDAAANIRGEAGTVVTIVVQRDSVVHTFTVTREEITLPTVKSHMLTKTVGYFRISQFAEHTAEDFNTQYNQLCSEGMTSFVLDLRDNPGGLLNSAEEVANVIMPEGTLVSMTPRGSKTTTYTSNGENTPIPMVVLINKGSASASEIIAGAIQDRKLGTIVGVNSYGKGTVQTIYPNLDGEGIKVTIAKYHTPNDRVIDGIGIKPDVEIDLPKGVSPSGTISDIQIQKALELLQE